MSRSVSWARFPITILSRTSQTTTSPFESTWAVSHGFCSQVLIQAPSGSPPGRNEGLTLRACPHSLRISQCEAYFGRCALGCQHRIPKLLRKPRTNSVGDVELHVEVNQDWIPAHDRQDLDFTDA